MEIIQVMGYIAKFQSLYWGTSLTSILMGNAGTYC
jgi:hypothetical protein